jgi:Protein of unknown function (DUF2911)
MSPRRALLFTLVFASVACASSVDAQIRASEPASFSQTIDGTVFEMEYYRPRARGRSPLFGKGAVVWEELWTPGANWATSIEFQKPIKLDGIDLDAGKYGIWFQMSEDEFLPQEIVLEPYVRRFHTRPPPPNTNQIRLPITIGEAPHKELLTWDFEQIRSNGGVLALRWGTNRIEFDIRVEPSMRQTVTEEEAAAVLGSYSLIMVSPTGEESPGATIELTVRDDETLHADIEGVTTADTPTDTYFNSIDMMLLPVLDGIFAPGEAYDGELREVWEKAFVEFTVVDGIAESFQFRDEDDAVFMKGSRVDAHGRPGDGSGGRAPESIR